MRYSLQHTIGHGGIEQTLLLNLSETGLAFLVESGFEPRIGEKIKVEIPIPGGEQIAWWATVVRIQKYSGPGWFSRSDQFDFESKVLVALHFEDLPEAHSRAIRQGLKNSFTQIMRDQKFRDWTYTRDQLLRNALRFTFFLLITALAIGFIYWFSQPDGTYDAKRGAPWGERFKF